MKIRELLDSEEKWIKGAYALVNRNDGILSAIAGEDDGATCWCLAGALNKCYPVSSENIRVDTKLNETTITRFKQGYISWQDKPERTFAEVKALVDELDV